MRLIDANELLEKCHWVIRSDGTRTFVCHAEDIEEAPVIETKSGKWILKFADNGWKDHTCSCCGYTENTDVHVTLGYNFCPNCGADMRKRKK